ncbi:MAG TPA: HAD-IA family hydrolase [Burkholderiales bacterium]|nr:HAD-IA family hydrolase [Burkholderiales bacterium]
MKYRLVVFDWDGTLIDSHSAIVECMQEASRELGLPIPERERASHVIGLGLHDAMRIVAPGLPAPRYPEFVDAYRRHFRAREDAMQPFPGMPLLVGSLQEERTLAIATGKSRRGLDRALKATGLERHFRASRCADETSPKPHPAMLLELMEALHFSPQQVVMIGDTSHDMRMAAAAGVDAVAVSYGAHPRQELLACRPLQCVSSVEELREWLTRNG